MDQYLVRVFDGFLDSIDESGFTVYDFIDYVKARYPKKTPSSTAASHLCRRSARCKYDYDLRCYMVIA